jgi:hypothetical protein
MAVTKTPGARYASIRFVTGMLDLISDRGSFIELVKRVKDPLLVLYGAETPRRSKAEMEALISVTHVKSVELPHGKLAVHEEFPVHRAIERGVTFLDTAGTACGGTRNGSAARSGTAAIRSCSRPNSASCGRLTDAS